jgi:hypothetical protein
MLLYLKMIPFCHSLSDLGPHDPPGMAPIPGAVAVVSLWFLYNIKRPHDRLILSESVTALNTYGFVDITSS